jgi:hypothetical protein
VQLFLHNSNNNNFLVYLIHMKRHIDIALIIYNYLQIANKTISCNDEYDLRRFSKKIFLIFFLSLNSIQIKD